MIITYSISIYAYISYRTVQWRRAVEWRLKGDQSLCRKSPFRSWHLAVSSPSGDTRIHTYLQHRSEQYTVHCHWRPIAGQIYHSIHGFLNVLLVLAGYWSHSFVLLSPPHRVSLDPKAQKLVGVLRFYLSQFSPKYRRGSVMEENPPEALQKPLAQWVHMCTQHCCPSKSWLFLSVLHWSDGKGWNHLNYDYPSVVKQTLASFKNEMNHDRQESNNYSCYISNSII